MRRSNTGDILRIDHIHRCLLRVQWLYVCVKTTTDSCKVEVLCVYSLDGVLLNKVIISYEITTESGYIRICF